MTILKHIPNLITLLNLFCGCVAIVFIANSNFLMAFVMVSLGIFFDFFDGFFARLWHVSSPLGVQLDSLADMVTSGLVPGLMMYQFIKLQFFEGESNFLAYTGFFITLGACYRLANFNIDTRQSVNFIGLPTPANALFILSLPLISFDYQNTNYVDLFFNKYIILFIIGLSVYIMNANVELFSLKVKSFNLKDNKLVLLFLLSAILIICTLHFLGVALVIVFYVLLSVIQNNFFRKKA